MNNNLRQYNANEMQLAPTPENHQISDRIQDQLQEDDDEWIEEIEEEEVYGKIIFGTDGQFHIELNDGEKECDIDMGTIKTVQVVEDVDGRRKFLIENNAQRDKLIAEKARSKVEEAIRRKEAIAQRAQEQRQKADNPVEYDNEEIIQEEVLEYDANDYYTLRRHGRPRVYGSCHCTECGQSFANMARLERHLAVHQQYGAYLCPLCGKTYKYEYNLFYHWRRTCKDMNELLSFDERKVIEINALRQLIEEIAHKKASIGSLELDGISYYPESHNRHPFHSNVAKTTSHLSTHNLFAGNVVPCGICNLTVYNQHLPDHVDVHRGRRAVDENGVGGAFFCDLCGLMFRTHENLMKHWRMYCPEIIGNLPHNWGYEMSDEELKQMLNNMLNIESFGQEEEDAIVSANFSINNQPGPSKSMDEAANPRDGPSFVEHVESGQQQHSAVENWAEKEGIMFADDLLDETREGTLVIADDGKLVTRRGVVEQPSSSERHVTVVEYRQAPSDDMKWIQYPQSVQCNECFRSFSSVQRLEKHMAGAHYSFGTHHCLFCGGRFKYEYNLLYHYRQVCQYSLELVDKEAREQMEAADLKKTIRQLATRREFHPHAGESAEGGQEPTITTTMTKSERMALKAELGDGVCRRQMMDKIIQKYSKKEHHRQDQMSASKQSNVRLPPALFQPSFRPHLPNGNQCPICCVTFYGLKVLARHLKAAHPNESAMWEQTLEALSAEHPESTTAPKLQPSRLGAPSGRKMGGVRRRKHARGNLLTGESEERPPHLEIEENNQQNLMEEEVEIEPDLHGNRKRKIRRGRNPSASFQ